MIEWITEEEVKEAAAKGRKEAFLCSIKHWKQICSASEGELGNAIVEGKVDITSDFCALCQRYVDSILYIRPPESGWGCPGCKLRCWTVWPQAEDALNRWLAYSACDSRREYDWKMWRKFSKQMLSKLEHVYSTLYPKE